MNVAMVYSIDSYRPIAGECIVAILGFKGKRDNIPEYGHKLMSHSLLYILAVFLHKSLGGEEWLPLGLWSDGRNCSWDQYPVDCLLRLGKANQTCYSSVANV